MKNVLEINIVTEKKQINGETKYISQVKKLGLTSSLCDTEDDSIIEIEETLVLLLTPSQSRYYN